jgi:GntR family transcriptional regulator, transcriptional repressor for pyruvate dehydrogenase complex
MSEISDVAEHDGGLSRKGRDRDPLRAPRVAEVVAAKLRERILERSFAELPTQEALIREFGVSYPSLREALRILETEGLVTVRRGVIGGAVVHRPSSERIAHLFGLLLESSEVSLSDLGTALTLMEPICTGLCAVAEHRARIADQLDELTVQAKLSTEDAIEFTRLSRRFHDALVKECGNTTFILTIGVLETLWSAHEEAWAERAQADGGYPAAALRLEVVRVHGRIAKAIRAGDADAAMRIAKKHLNETQRFVLKQGQDRPVHGSGLG